MRDELRRAKKPPVEISGPPSGLRFCFVAGINDRSGRLIDETRMSEVMTFPHVRARVACLSHQNISAMVSRRGFWASGIPKVSPKFFGVFRLSVSYWFYWLRGPLPKKSSNILKFLYIFRRISSVYPNLYPKKFCLANYFWYNCETSHHKIFKVNQQPKAFEIRVYLTAIHLFFQRYQLLS
jgi:hypothetical protein